LGALLVFYTLLYILTARSSGAPGWSFIRVHARPALVFAIVLFTAAPIRSWLHTLAWRPLPILIVSVSVSGVALLGATKLLKNRLWGDFLYQYGLSAAAAVSSGAGNHKPGT
jgi:hypothetical protein